MEKIQQNKFFNLNKNKNLLFFGLVLVFWWVFLSKTSFSESNIIQDRDQDGLTDAEEYLYGTDPDNPDTDGDGYSDGVEVEAGYDPLKPAPGDKIVFESQIENEVQLKEEESPNLTEEFFENLTTEKDQELDILGDYYNNPDKYSEQENLNNLSQVSLTSEDIQKFLEQTTEEIDLNQEMELISESELRILDEIKGDDEKSFQKEKEQIEKYFTEIFYIISFNKPFSVEDQNFLIEAGVSYIEELSGVVNSGIEKERLTELKERSQKTYEDCLEIETPYKTKEIHQKTLSLIKYLNENINEEKIVDRKDPLTMALYIGKLQAALTEGELIESSIREILQEYEIEIFNEENLESIF
jgi:hypothetical protein